MCKVFLNYHPGNYIEYGKHDQNETYLGYGQFVVGGDNFPQWFQRCQSSQTTDIIPSFPRKFP
jgi:hypothetical protein